MKPILELNQDIQNKIQEIEHQCEFLCKQVSSLFTNNFKEHDLELIVEFLRTKNKHVTKEQNYFQKEYHSFIEVGIEKDGEYIPNARLSIWKCKEEWFKLVGYITEYPTEKIEEFVKETIKEMMVDLNEKL
ncbi:hypothetical protein GCM10008967_28420 [Bacillus carboniphilus]|uniref:Uncharacterized protein n=1 Tax=Bacillus carboniphilus TaxID=86663 RepID=A0ABN0WG28_9BACI